MKHEKMRKSTNVEDRRRKKAKEEESDEWKAARLAAKPVKKGN